MDIDLPRTSVGAPAAERDIAIGLRDYFAESEAYKRIADSGRRRPAETGREWSMDARVVRIGRRAAKNGTSAHRTGHLEAAVRGVR